MKMIWSKKSLFDYDLILEQLSEKWGFAIAEDFEFNIFNLINHIENYNHICPKSKIKKFHKCVINKHISMIYKLENKKLVLITFLFNKASHFY